MRTPLVAAALALALPLVAGCPGPEENAPVLWLDLEGGETDVRLVSFQPPYY